MSENPFENLGMDTTIQAPTDSIYRKGAMDSGIMDFAIDMAYTDMTKGGSKAVHFTFINSDKRKLRVTQYATGGTAKGQNNFYLDKDGTKQYLPGFNIINAICLLTTGKELKKQTFETKTIKVYDFKAKADVPTKKLVITSLVGKMITLGVLKQIEDKNKLGDDGNYYATGETRETNEIGKVFRASDGLTVQEIKGGQKEPLFKMEWDKEYTGTVVDKSTKVGTDAAPSIGGFVPAETPAETITFGA